MKIQQNRFTPNARRVCIFLTEKSLNIPVEQLNSDTGPSGLSESEEAQISNCDPVLVLDDGDRLEGVAAIWRYLEDTHTTPPLFGSDPKSRAKTEMWAQRIENSLFDFIYRTNARQIPAWGEICRDQAELAFKNLEQALEHESFIVGPALSIADISAFVAIEELEKEKVHPAQELAHLNRWLLAMKERSPVYAINHEVELCSA